MDKTIKITAKAKSNTLGTLQTTLLSSSVTIKIRCGLVSTTITPHTLTTTYNTEFPLGIAISSPLEILINSGVAGF